MTIWLRIIGIAMNAIGALLLAWRVKGILDAMISAQHTNDSNFRIFMEILENRPQSGHIIVGMNEQLEGKAKRGVWLLVLGFAFIAVGNILVGLSWCLHD